MMLSVNKQFSRHLRVIHACEKGATGVYWGHRWVAAWRYPDLVPALTAMHGHETEHYALFGQLLAVKNSPQVGLPILWCAGGILYGVVTALLGRRAIWKSTAIIEAIVEQELLAASEFFRAHDPQVSAAIEKILLDELQHKEQAQAQSLGWATIDAYIEPMAVAGAQLSKNLAEKL